ncbi:hypothetical protein JCM10207_008595 [Rhodosporidiobolus poonsookiae]
MHSVMPPVSSSHADRTEADSTDPPSIDHPSLPSIVPFPASPTRPAMAFPALERPKSTVSTLFTNRRESLYNPAAEHLRSRHLSLPASLVQTRYSTMVGSSGSSTLRVKDRGGHRISVASFSSIDSVQEEEEDESAGDGAPALEGTAPRGPRPRAISRRSASPRPASMARPPSQTRYSLPKTPYDGGYQSFGAAVRDSRATSMPSSPMSEAFAFGGEETVDGAADRDKREDRRWRIAEEMKETEKAYVRVLEEIDALYYQPLVSSLPATDPLSRRASARNSAGGAGPSSRSNSPTVSPRASIYANPSFNVSPRSRTSTRGSVDSTGSSPSTAPSTPPSPHPAAPSGPILNRRALQEVFSNFTDVLNLSHIMLLTIDEAVPDRPSQPLPLSLSPKSSASPLVATPEAMSKPASAPPAAALGGGSSLESQVGGLSTSAETTASSSGPATPENHGSPTPSAPPRTRTRTTSVRSTRKATQPPSAPPVRLGKALLPILPFLKQYSLFVANFSASLARLSSLEAPLSSPVRPVVGSGAPGSTVDDRARWQAFAAGVQKEREQAEAEAKGPTGALGGTSRIGLGGLLLNIVQRVPRYRLLLQDLIRFTEEDHPDLPDLKTAFALVDGVATHLESQIQTHTADLQFLDLQRAFTNLDHPLLSPGRKLLKTGFVRKLNRSGKEQTRVLFLCTDILLHASGGETGGAWSAVGLGISNAGLGAEEAPVIGQGAQYRLHQRLELEDVTVVGSDEVGEGGLKYGFEILSTTKSFAVYADSLEARTAWLDAIRDAKAALMSDRRTLQRSPQAELAPIKVTSPESSPAPDRPVKRISLPVPPTPAASEGPSHVMHHSISSLPPRQVSQPPLLSDIPPTPGTENGELAPDSFTHSTEELVTSPTDISGPEPPRLVRALDFALPPPAAALSSADPAALLLDEPQTPPRSRRWSEINPSAAVQALASALSLGPGATSLLPSATSFLPSADDLASGTVEYPVIEAYSAPVWVPDSRVWRCKGCKMAFGVWRRRHHCRLCGSVVCWACSSKYFIIPGALLSRPLSSSSPSNAPPAPDRLARACDTCYDSVFTPAPSSRFLDSHPADDFPSIPPQLSQTTAFASRLLAPAPPAEFRLSRILNPASPDAPLFDFGMQSPPFKPVSDARLPSVPPLPSGLDLVGGSESAAAAPSRPPLQHSQPSSQSTGVPKRQRKVSAVNELRKVLGQRQ